MAGCGATVVLGQVSAHWWVRLVPRLELAHGWVSQVTGCPEAGAAQWWTELSPGGLWLQGFGSPGSSACALVYGTGSWALCGQGHVQRQLWVQRVFKTACLLVCVAVPAWLVTWPEASQYGSLQAAGGQEWGSIPRLIN